MPVVVGPALSLSASGLMGKALLYYDTRFGARIRSPKKRFVPPGSAWEVNKEWFRAASARSKTLDWAQKRAWQIAYPQLCDSWRDIFMGRQIEAWNLSPLNNLTWPQVAVQDIGNITFLYKTVWVEEKVGNKVEVVQRLNVWYDQVNRELVRFNTCASLWWNILDDVRYPTEGDIYVAGRNEYYKFELTPGHTNVLWGGSRYLNGTYVAFNIGQFTNYP